MSTYVVTDQELEEYAQQARAWLRDAESPEIADQEYVPGKIYRVKEAAISSHLEYLTAPERAEFPSSAGDGGRHRPHVKIVGSGLPNTHGDYPHRETWRSLLSKWLQQGVCVEYLVIDDKIRDSAVEFFRTLEETTGATIEIYLMKSRGADDHDAGKARSQLVSCYKNRHFTVFHNPDMVWMEGSHLPDQFIAHNCKFYDPIVVKRHPFVLEGYSEKFQEMKGLAERVPLRG